jgi:hypothetical protein
VGRWARALALTSITALTVTGGATPCWAACECPPRTAKQVLEDADAAFVGRVEGVVFMDAGHSIQTFRVEQVYEGALGPTVSVHLRLDGECPAIYYPRGERVGVVARLQSDGSYAVAACDFVLIEDMERFGGPARAPLPAGASPQPPRAPDPVEPGTDLPFWAVAAIGALVALAIIGFASRGRTRSPARDGTTTEEAPR